MAQLNKNIFAWIILGFFFTTTVESQNLKDSLFIYHLKIFQDGKNLSLNEALEVTKPITNSYNEMKMAKRSYQTGFALGFFGGGLVGYSAGRAINNQKINLPIFSIGVGFILLDFLYLHSYKIHVNSAVSIFNSNKGNIKNYEN